MYHTSIKKKGKGKPSFNGHKKAVSTNSGRSASGAKRKAVSDLDPQLLVRQAIVSELPAFVPSRTFNEWSLHSKLKMNLARKGFTNPTQIQEEAFDPLVAGRDLLGIAQTGTGKTGAFLIPIIQQLIQASQPFRSLVVVPTRELALQVEEEFKSLTAGMGVHSATFIGGTNIARDLELLRRQNHLVIGTPGRLIDLAGRGALRLQDIRVLVLDEFDRMLDMGFVHDIKRIVKAMTTRKQTMLFSATVDRTQKPMINELLTDPVEVKVSQGNSTADQIDQDIIRVPQGVDKFTLLLNLLEDQEFEKVLVFAETKRMVNKIGKRLNDSGVTTDLIHGNKSQNYRNAALDKFKRGSVQVLVATDVAARGIDVSDVTHVINYQLPMSFDNYVHRIGRTGRAGKRGKAFTFVD